MALHTSPVFSPRRRQGADLLLKVKNNHAGFTTDRLPSSAATALSLLKSAICRGQPLAARCAGSSEPACTNPRLIYHLRERNHGRGASLAIIESWL